MKGKIFFLGLILLSFIAVHASERVLIMVSADGSKDTYTLDRIQKITFKPDGMDVDRKNNVNLGGVKCVIFDKNEVPIFVYPNPVVSYLKIKGISDDTAWNITDANGRIIRYGEGTIVDVSDFIDNVYILHVEDKYIKFIKK